MCLLQRCRHSDRDGRGGGNTRRGVMQRFRKFDGLLIGLFVAIASMASQPAFTQVQSPAASKADIQRGMELTFGRTAGNCLACHEMEGGEMPGNIGPALVDMKARYPDREILFQRLWDETQFSPMTVMPTFGRNGI